MADQTMGPLCASAGCRAAEAMALRYTVVGWREWDWPEGFDRRTAQLIADRVQDHLAKAES